MAAALKENSPIREKTVGKTRTAVGQPEESYWSQGTLIRPSPAFLSQPRDAPPAHGFHTTHTINTVNRPCGTRPPADSLAIARGMKELEARKDELAKEASRLLPALARKQVYEAEKKQHEDYSVLKSQRLLGLKRQRILSNEYRGGVLGEERPRSMVRGNSPARTEKLAQYMKTNAGIEFHNSESASASPEKLRVHTRRSPEQSRHHFHNTYESLFIADQPSQDQVRLSRLTAMTRGRYNIVTGARY